MHVASASPSSLPRGPPPPLPVNMPAVQSPEADNPGDDTNAEPAGEDAVSTLSDGVDVETLRDSASLPSAFERALRGEVLGIWAETDTVHIPGTTSALSTAAESSDQGMSLTSTTSTTTTSAGYFIVVLVFFVYVAVDMLLLLLFGFAGFFFKHVLRYLHFLLDDIWGRAAFFF